MPLLTIELQKNGASNKSNVSLFGSIAKQPLILTSYFIEFPIYANDGATINDKALNTRITPNNTQKESEKTLKIILKLPFLNNYDSNTNSVVSGTIPLFLDTCILDANVITICNGTYRQCDYDFNIARNIPESFNDFEIYNAYGYVYPINDYKITLNFTYRRPELI